LDFWEKGLMGLERRKVGIVGAGHVGGTTAQRLMEKNGVSEIVLLDIARDLAIGKALDLSEAAPLSGSDTDVRGTDRYSELGDCDVVIITSGIPRKPGMSRDDLLSVNANIMKTVTEQVVKVAPECILIVVSNPLDAMTYVAHRISGFPRERIMGMAGVLDSARMASFIASELSVSVNSIQTMVMGGHGDSMVPLIGYTTVAGVPVKQLLSKDKLDAIVSRTRQGGAEIVKLLKTGSAYYAPSAAIVEMVMAILGDKKKILPCAALCEGEYGVRNLFVGVPSRLGHGGMEGVVEYQLSAEEEAGLKRSTEAVRQLVSAVDRLVFLRQ
jgi:malate dehydrogenase